MAKRPMSQCLRRRAYTCALANHKKEIQVKYASHLGAQDGTGTVKLRGGASKENRVAMQPCEEELTITGRPITFRGGDGFLGGSIIVSAPNASTDVVHGVQFLSGRHSVKNGGDVRIVAGNSSSIGSTAGKVRIEAGLVSSGLGGAIVIQSGKGESGTGNVFLHRPH